MTSKQRVGIALCMQPVDRVSVFMWFHPDTSRKLSDLLSQTMQHANKQLQAGKRSNTNEQR